MRYTDIARDGEHLIIDPASAPPSTMHRVKERDRQAKPKDGPPEVSSDLEETIHAPIPPVRRPSDQVWARKHRERDRQLTLPNIELNDMARAPDTCVKTAKGYVSEMAQPKPVPAIKPLRSVGKSGPKAPAASRKAKLVNPELLEELQRAGRSVLAGERGVVVSDMSHAELTKFLGIKE